MSLTSAPARLLALLLATLAPSAVTTAQTRPVVEQTALTASLETAPRVELARAEADLIAQQRRQLQSESGWQAFGAITAGRLNEIEANGGNRRYDQLQGDIGLSHPLLGSVDARKSRLLELERARLRAQGETRATTRAVAVELRRLYAGYWVSEQRIRRAARWQRRLETRLESLRGQVGGTLRASEFAEVQAALREAREDGRQARYRQAMQRGEMQALLGREVGAFEPRWPVADGICRRQAVLFEAALQADPTILAARRELALLLDRGEAGLTREIDSSLVITHSQTVEAWDERGDASRIGLTAEIPLRLGAARDARRDLRNAEVLQLQRRLEAARAALRGRIGVSLGDLRQASAARRAAAAQLTQARADWREAQRRLEAGLERSPMPALRAGLRWYRRGDERLRREADWLTARAPLAALETPGCGTQRPAPMDLTDEEAAAS